MSLNTNKEDIMELFGLEDSDVEDFQYQNLNGNAQISVRLVPHYEPCPECGCKTPRIKDYYWKKITHSVLSDRKCTLLYRARRYVCPVCHRTYAEKNPFSFGSMSISAFTVQRVLTDLKNYNETFSSVARRYHLSPATAAYLFDDHVSLPRKPLPEMISFDEVYAFRNYSEKFVCVLMDFQKQTPIDFLNSRREDRLLSYFMKIPLEERKKVKACSFDMYDTYRTVMKKCFPNSIGIVDRFHLCQELGRQTDSVRIRAMKGTTKGSDEYYLLKKFNWILYRHSDSSTKDGKKLFDPNGQRRYNNHFKFPINYYDLREKLLKISPELMESWNLKEKVYDYYETATPNDREQKLNELIMEFRKSQVPEMRHFASTLTKWRTEIINSLTTYGYIYKVDSKTGKPNAYHKRMTNAIIENRNSICKCIKKNANGYHNWDRFRNRLMYVLDKDATYSLNPIHSNVTKTAK